MQKENIRLVITVALKAELPLGFLKAHNVRVVTLKGLKSGVLNLNMVAPEAGNRGVLFVVTGPGAGASSSAAEWICENLSPVAVVNVGTVGLLPHASFDFLPGLPVRVSSVSNYSLSRTINLQDTVPFPLPSAWNNTMAVGSLVTADNADHLKDRAGQGGFDVVDMEAWFQAERFERAGIPFHGLKFISDRVDSPVEDEFFSNLEAVRSVMTEMLGFLSWGIQPPGFSVVIPVYNRETAILRSVESVLAQKYPASEVLVVDDGSTDSTAQVLEGFGERIKVIRLSRNSGVSAARNAGVLAAGNEWVAFLDSDDRWKPDKLQKDAEFIKNNPFFEIFQSDEQWIRHGRRVNRCKHHLKPEGWIFDRCVERCMISPSAVVMKRGLFDLFGPFDENLPVCEDYDLWLRISRRRAVGLNPEETVVKYGGADDQLSSTFEAMDRFRVQALLKFLGNEEVETFRKTVEKSLIFRVSLLLNGALKRGKHEDVTFYNGLLDKIKESEWFSGDGFH